MKIIKMTSLFLSSLLSASICFAEGSYKQFGLGRFDLNLSADYFKTETNYDLGANQQKLLSGGSLQSINLKTSARYLYFANFGVSSGLVFNNIESNDNLNKRTNSVLTNYVLAADYQFLNIENFQLYTDLSFILANEKIDLAADTVLASDGAHQLISSLVGIYGSDLFRINTRLGINYRTEGLSMLLIYGLGGEIIFYNSALGLDISGFNSIKDDENTNSPLLRDTLTNKVNAGSRKYYSVNPNLLEAQMYFSYKISHDFLVKTFLNSTVSGANYAAGQSVGVELNWGFGGHSLTARKKLNSKFPETESGFKIDTSDGVDQNLFKKIDTVKPKK